MLRKIAVPIIACIVFLLLWELLVWANGWPNYVMASPSDLPAHHEEQVPESDVGGWQIRR